VLTCEGGETSSPAVAQPSSLWWWWLTTLAAVRSESVPTGVTVKSHLPKKLEIRALEWNILTVNEKSHKSQI